MNKKLFLSITAFSFVFITTPVYATTGIQYNTDSTNAAKEHPNFHKATTKALENGSGNQALSHPSTEISSEKAAELKARVEQERAKIAERIQNRIQERCTHIEDKIQTRITTFEENKQRHINKYNQSKEKFGELIVKLQKKGLDTSKLEEDGKTLDEKIQKFGTDYAAFIAALEETQTHACGESEGAFVESLKGAREKLKIVREDVQDIKTFYRETIKADILELRSSNNL